MLGLFIAHVNDMRTQNRIVVAEISQHLQALTSTLHRNDNDPKLFTKGGKKTVRTGQWNIRTREN